jgi:hypothetical protein
MLMRRQEMCVLHVLGAGDGETLETLCRTTQVIARLGVEQRLRARDRESGVEIWSAALPVEVRALSWSGPAFFGKIRALQSELCALSRERALYAVHLHGLGPCLLGSRAIKGTPLRGRVLYSPHLADSASPWAVVLLLRFFHSNLAPHDCAAVTASLTEAQTLSKLLNRSAEVLPHPVSPAFFEADRRESPKPTVLVDGEGPEAVAAVSRLSVLLNGRDARVSIAWLGAADGRARAQLDAAAVKILAAEDDTDRARTLSGAWLFIHLASGNRLPHRVVQAMAAGAPCLVSDTPSHRTLICHGETGFVCTSEHDLIEKLIVLLRDPAERQRIGEAARSEAERRFTSGHFERALLRAYGLSATGLTHEHRLLSPAVA